jgi:hypothetical protein
MARAGGWCRRRRRRCNKRPPLLVMHHPVEHGRAQCRGPCPRKAQGAGAATPGCCSPLGPATRAGCCRGQTAVAGARLANPGPALGSQCCCRACFAAGVRSAAVAGAAAACRNPLAAAGSGPGAVQRHSTAFAFTLCFCHSSPRQCDISFFRSWPGIMRSLLCPVDESLVSLVLQCRRYDTLTPYAHSSGLWITPCCPPALAERSSMHTNVTAHDPGAGGHPPAARLHLNFVRPVC